MGAVLKRILFFSVLRLKLFGSSVVPPELFLIWRPAEPWASDSETTEGSWDLISEAFSEVGDWVLSPLAAAGTEEDTALRGRQAGGDSDPVGTMEQPIFQGSWRGRGGVCPRSETNRICRWAW